MRHDDFLFHSFLLCLLNILEKKKRKLGAQVILKTLLNMFIDGTQDNPVTMDKTGVSLPFSAVGRLVLAGRQNNFPELNFFMRKNLL